MKEKIAQLLSEAAAETAAGLGLGWDKSTPIEVEDCREEKFGDFSSNIAMALASRTAPKKIPPRTLGEELLRRLPVGGDLIGRAEVAGPGFLNFFIQKECWLDALREVLLNEKTYGKSSVGAGRKVQVEFVSANPTGPLHLGHGRGAAVGDILAGILAETGHVTEKEFYINDAGRQIDLLSASVLARCRELAGREAAFPEDGYRGEYIYDIARKVLAEKGDSWIDGEEDRLLEELQAFATALVLEWIRKDLADFGVEFDTWFSETSLYGDDSWDRLVDLLKSRDLVYEEKGALWFRSSRYGDDKDRVVVKSDGSRTYLASDMLYHDDKFRRGFERLVNVWGADHHGYIPRMKAVAQALGHSAEALDVRLVQLVTLTRKGKAVAMGKRQGQFTTLAEVIAEVGRDAARFFFLMRRCESSLEFDLDLAKERSADNPVYYVQYAHARINSIFRTRSEKGLEEPPAQEVDLSPLGGSEEMGLIRKVALYPDALVKAARTLEPHHLAAYLVGLAGSFHSYYNKVRVITDDERLSYARLALVRAVGIVVRNGLGVMGIEAPETM
jgi:arginyl-tRNA synthetase